MNGKQALTLIDQFERSLKSAENARTPFDQALAERSELPAYDALYAAGVHLYDHQTLQYQGDHLKMVIDESLDPQALYDRLWPQHCRSCEGYGQFSRYVDPSPAGVSLGSGSMEDAEPCAECTEHGICPRCGRPGLTNQEEGRGDDVGAGPCTFCKWNYDSGRPAPPMEGASMQPEFDPDVPEFDPKDVKFDLAQADKGVHAENCPCGYCQRIRAGIENFAKRMQAYNAQQVREGDGDGDIR